MDDMKSKRHLLILLSLAMPLMVSAASTITALGVLPGKASSSASGVSGDGQVVVGTSTDTRGTANEAFRWTASGGMVGLGFLPGGSTSVGRAVSKDGTTIVGDATSSYAKVIGGTEAFRYRDGVMSGLHTSTLLIMSQGWAVSGDGSVVVDSNGSRRWTSALGVEQNIIPYTGFGVSSDGSVVVGRSSGFVAQRWTAATGVVDFPNAAGGSSAANAVSGNGLVAVGNKNNVACYWSQSAGFVSIGTAGVISSALAVNYDGSMIVGRANTAPGGGTEAFIWTAAGGMQSLANLLKTQGVDLSFWLYKGAVSLVEATGISDDGRFLVGNGTKQGFLLQLDLGGTPSLLDQWRQTQFGSAANAGNAADTADPDNDGVPNLIEYALGSNPTSATNKPSFTIRLVGDHLSFGFNRVADSTLTYSVEGATSLGLGDWVAVWTSTGTNNVAGPVEVADSAKILIQPTRFLRLKVSHY